MIEIENTKFPECREEIVKLKLSEPDFGCLGGYLKESIEAHDNGDDTKTSKNFFSCLNDWIIDNWALLSDELNFEIDPEYNFNCIALKYDMDSRYDEDGQEQGEYNVYGADAQSYYSVSDERLFAYLKNKIDQG